MSRYKQMKFFTFFLIISVILSNQFLYSSVTNAKVHSHQTEGSKKLKFTIETSMGNMSGELYSKEAPKTVENFVTLSNKGFYEGIIFHRVIPGFMVQTGDPTGTGMGGPGYQFEDEFSANLRHDKPGVLSMANAGPNTNGSQFFITEVPTPFLDDRHAVFGIVTEGVDLIGQIANVPRDGRDKPKDEIKINKITISES